jgi:excinuclease ABC subunit A
MCEECKGRRYNRETLEIKYRGRSVAEMLDLTVDQALLLVEHFPPVATKLRTLQDVGLGYIKLGQSATTLSGGEAQRVKLAKELSKRGTGRTLYILDEPTTGLHFDDVKKLLDVLNKLVDQGNTVVVIEHNLDVIKTADHLIDLGPDGGEAGGHIVAEGSPEEVAADETSYTGQVLAEVLGARGLHAARLCG